VEGLQLADLVAWSVCRFIRHRARFDEGADNQFDRIALKVVANLEKLDDLLARTAAIEVAHSP
jgi:hypothetical protein